MRCSLEGSAVAGLVPGHTPLLTRVTLPQVRQDQRFAV